MLPPVYLDSFSRYTPIRDIISQGVASYANSGAFTANRAEYSPIIIPWWYPVKRVWCFNGSAVSGNIEIGLYSKDGSRVFTTGSFAQAGTSVIQYRSLSYLIPPGSYYIAMVADNTSSNFIRTSFTGLNASEMGLLMQTSAMPLPAVMNPVSSTVTTYKLFGLTLTESGFS